VSSSQQNQLRRGGTTSSGEKLDINGDGKPRVTWTKPSKDGLGGQLDSASQLDVHLLLGTATHVTALRRASANKVINGTHIHQNHPLRRGRRGHRAGHAPADRYKAMRTLMTSSTNYASGRNRRISTRPRPCRHKFRQYAGGRQRFAASQSASTAPAESGSRSPIRAVSPSTVGTAVKR